MNVELADRDSLAQSRLRVIASFSRRLSAGQDEEEIARLLADAAIALVQGDLATVVWEETEHGGWQTVTTRSEALGDDGVLAFERTIGSDWDRIAAADDTPLDGIAVDQHRAAGAGPGVAALMTAPIVAGQRYIATIFVGRAIGPAFGEDERTLLSILGNQAALAFERVRLQRALGQASRNRAKARALYEMTRELTANLELNEILKALVDRARDLLDTDMAYLTLVDRETNDLYVRITSGTRGEGITRLRMKGERGFARLAIQHGTPIVVPDVLSDPRRIPDHDDEVPRAEGMASLLCAPVQLVNEQFGALSVANRRSTHFDDDDVELIVALANAAAVAIENARHYEQERQRVTQLEKLNGIVDEQRQQLSRLMAIHDQLTPIVLQDRGLEAITMTLAELVANPVLVEDRFFHLLAHASPAGTIDEHRENTIKLGRSPRHTLLDEEIGPQILRMFKERKPTKLPRVERLGMANPRVVAPIVLGNDVLGHVSILESNRTLDEFDLLAVEHAATIIALELMKLRTAAEVEARLKGDFLDDLFSGAYGDERTMLVRASFLGYDASSHYQVLLVDVDSFDDTTMQQSLDEGQALALKQTLLDSVRRSISIRYPGSTATLKAEQSDRRGASAPHAPAAAVGRNGHVVVVLTAPAQRPPFGRREIDELLQAIKGNIARLLPNMTVSIGVGSACSSLFESRRSYEEAQMALDVLRSFQARDRILTSDELGIYRILAHVDDRGALVGFVDQTLSALEYYDRKHRAELVKTLQAFVHHNFEHKPTAEALCVHPHTLRYRLRRIKEIAGLDLDHPERRLEVHVAIKLRHLLRR